MQSALDIEEGLFLHYAISALRKVGVFELLASPHSSAQIALALKLDSDVLAPTLEFVALRTELIEKSGDKYCVTDQFGDNARFLFDFYGGAYLGNVIHLEEILQGHVLAGEFVDRRKHALALSRASGHHLDWLVNAIGIFGVSGVLDIGCGPGTLLLRLAQRDAAFIGLGIESNKATCEIARESLAAFEVSDRVEIVHANGNDFFEVLPEKSKQSVQAIAACQFLNEFFSVDSQRVVAWLIRLSKVFPGRLLFVADYYSQLGTKATRCDRLTLLHDLVQMLSGQGIPPSDLEGWKEIYSEADCALIHQVSDTHSTRFLHVVKFKG